MDRMAGFGRGTNCVDSLRPQRRPFLLAWTVLLRLVHGLWGEIWQRRRILAVQGLGLQTAVALRSTLVILVHSAVHDLDDGLWRSSAQTLGTRPQGQISNLALR